MGIPLGMLMSLDRVNNPELSGGLRILGLSLHEELGNAGIGHMGSLLNDRPDPPLVSLDTV